ncbi:MAG: 3'-5' exonuclease [bacterium]
MITIDVEASGFGRGSYPIEVGVAMDDFSTHCFLIKPENDWERWDESAEAIHNLSRETLEAHGSTALEVARELNELLGGQEIYSDAWGFDSSWLALLFHQAGIPQGFKLKAINALLKEEQLNRWAETREGVCAELNLTRHRASADALIIQQTYLRSINGDDHPLPDFGLLSNEAGSQLCHVPGRA